MLHAKSNDQIDNNRYSFRENKTNEPSNYFLDGGTSDNPCSDVYAGKHPESEIEVKTISNYVRSIADKLNLYLAVHSRGQYVLVPFGYSAAPYPPNYKDLMQIGKRAAVDMYKVHKTPYRVGTTADVLCKFHRSHSQ